jgi:hypothetical protein
MGGSRTGTTHSLVSAVTLTPRAQFPPPPTAPPPPSSLSVAPLFLQPCSLLLLLHLLFLLSLLSAAFVVGAWMVTVPLCYPLSKAIHPVRVLRESPARPYNASILILHVVCLCCKLLQRLEGLWVALIIGYGVTTAIAVVAVVRSDWPALALAALTRSEKAVVAGPSVAVLPVIAETLSEPETEFTMFAEGESGDGAGSERVSLGPVFESFAASPPPPPPPSPSGLTRCPLPECPLP